MCTYVTTAEGRTNVEHQMAAELRQISSELYGSRAATDDQVRKMLEAAYLIDVMNTQLQRKTSQVEGVSQDLRTVKDAMITMFKNMEERGLGVVPEQSTITTASPMNSVLTKQEAPLPGDARPGSVIKLGDRATEPPKQPAKQVFHNVGTVSPAPLGNAANDSARAKLIAEQQARLNKESKKKAKLEDILRKETLKDSDRRRKAGGGDTFMLDGK
jgi:hypothetical protein